MKFWIQLLILTIVDFVIIWFCLRQGDPSPSVSIGLVLLVPFVVIINLIIAGILYLTKRQYALLFIANAVPSAILMFYLFIAGLNRHQRLRYDEWNFRIRDTTFIITHSKLDNRFFIEYSTNSGSSSSFLEGQFVAGSNDYYILTTDSTKYIIKGDYLFNFKNVDSIKLTRVIYQ